MGTGLPVPGGETPRFLLLSAAPCISGLAGRCAPSFFLTSMLAAAREPGETTLKVYAVLRTVLHTALYVVL